MNRRGEEWRRAEAGRRGVAADDEGSARGERRRIAVKGI